ncbi:MAG: Mu-like prophage major head subunit gpT family protein [Solirubrobacteraceae bacterium]
MPDRAAHWSELLTPQLTEAFYIGFSDNARRASLIERIFGTRTSERAFEEHLGVGQFGSEGWNFSDTGRVQYDQRNKGFVKRYTHVEFAKGFIVDRKLVDDNLTDISFDDAHELGDSAFRKREKGAASILNNAFVDEGENNDGLAIAGPDGMALCSAEHPHSQDDSIVQSNTNALALTNANLSVLRREHMAIKDDRGDIMDVMPNELIVPPELEDVAIPLTGSPLDPASANNAVNPTPGRFQTIVWHYLTGPKAWFLADSARRARSLLWYDRIPLEFGREEDFDTLQAKFRAYMRYSYGWRDWAWIFGSNPA